MANVKVTVWHDVAGEIVAVGRAMGDRKSVAVGGNGFNVLDIEIAEEEIKSLPQTHLVDSSRKAIVRRSSYGSTAD
ncbi:hypothetical protein [Streptomyces sp. DSM 40907]|uniref:hypothetical protein n=1 Tax=Streptomyces kutzneri TaxID=3051179 RepID=UPI0028D75A2D|nr:hypothetical protein [Streptomyces sp. DSM 40907]